MWTAIFVLGSALLVAVQVGVAIVNFDGSDASERAVQIEEQLDRELHELVDLSLAGPERAPEGRTAALDETKGSSG